MGPVVAEPVAPVPSAVPAAEAVTEAPTGRRRLADFNAHEWSVLIPLSLVGFFTNYDMGLLSLAAPRIAEGLDVSVATLGVGVAVIRLAALGSILTLRLADRWGRRTMLLLSVVAFAVSTGLTALAWSLVAYVAIQLVSRACLSTEETLAGVVLTEELRPDRRGAGIGLLGILSTTGFGLVAFLLLAVDATPLGWRLFYVVPLVPLLVVMWLRRNFQETRAFGVAAEQDRVHRQWWPRLRPGDRGRLWRLNGVLSTVSLLGVVSFYYASELAQDQYGWTGLFTVIILAAAPTTLLGYLLGGRLSDRYGRKPATVGTCVFFALGAVLLFTEVPALFAPGFFVLAGADAALQTVRTTYVAELFPTEVRATLSSFVYASNVVAGSVGLILVGLLAAVVDPSVVITVVAAVCALSSLLVRRLPETAGSDVIQAHPSD